DDSGEDDHTDAEDEYDGVDDLACAFEQEDADGQDAGDQAAELRVDDQQGVEAEPAAGDVADVEGQPADDDEDRQDDARAGDRGGGQLRGPVGRGGEQAPDMELDGDVDEDRREDREGEGRFHLRGERGRLRDEAGADRRGGHEEDGPDDGAAADLRDEFGPGRERSVRG